jgi:predicted ATPase
VKKSQRPAPAYGTLLREPRRALHARIAETIESQFDEIVENQPELLAHHFGEAGLAGPACDYRMRAGDRAVSRSACGRARRPMRRVWG